MNVLATTSQSVLLVDCMTGQASVLHRGAGLYYGIAQIGSLRAVAARRRLVSSPVPRIDERGCILLLDERLRVRDVIEAPFPLRDMHEIAWCDERLWVTCSFDDMIAVYDGAGWERWTPEVPPCAAHRPVRDVENDRRHFNSFLFAHDEIALLAHNHGPSDVHFFDRRSRSFRRTIELGTQAHNLWQEDEALVTCSSIEGKLVSSDGWELSTGDFPRGVCFTPAHRTVGLSALAERGQRDFASAAIGVHDASWRLLHYVHLVREGMILDLAPATDADIAHARRGGFEACRFPLLAQSTRADLAADQDSSADVST
jgi:hypothetical protein